MSEMRFSVTFFQCIFFHPFPKNYVCERHPPGKGKLVCVCVCVYVFLLEESGKFSLESVFLNRNV